MILLFKFLLVTVFELVYMALKTINITKIVEGNEPSMKLFIGADFTILDFKKGIYHLLYEGNIVRLSREQADTKS